MATKRGQRQPLKVATPKSAKTERAIDHGPASANSIYMSSEGTRNITPTVRQMMQRLKDIREGVINIPPFSGRSLGQKEFAKQFATNKKTYGEWERCAKAPPIWAIANFSRKNRISLDYIIHGIEPAQPPSMFHAEMEAPESLPKMTTRARAQEKSSKVS